MSRPKMKTSDQVARYQQVTLLELLDRLLDKGVVVKGEILLSVADIDLIYLNLGLLLSSVGAVQQAAGRNNGREAALISYQSAAQNELFSADHLDTRSESITPAPRATVHSQGKSANQELMAGTLPSVVHDGLDQLFAPRTTIDPAKVEKGLAKLVLTLVDLIRKLMEKQAVRRMDEGQLHAGEIERLGNAFYLLDEKMEQLKKTFGLEDEDLNIDLGPLGELL
jgi:gas vesicle protein GvpK/gas vesicle protein GvpA/GvpJ/GvpM family